MKSYSPAFGFISGISTSLGLLPHLLILFIILFTEIPPSALLFMIAFTVGAKFLCEWLFFNFCKRRLDSEETLKNWRSVFNKSLLSHPKVIVALLVIVTDICLEITLVFMALKTSLPPIWIFIPLLGCQALSSPIQGLLSDYFSRKKSLIFALAMCFLCTVVVGEISGNIKNQAGSVFSFSNLLGLSSFTTNVQILIIICCKGLLANLTVIGRAAIAEVVKFETLERFAPSKKRY
jgi:hypothetical protein